MGGEGKRAFDGSGVTYTSPPPSSEPLSRRHPMCPVCRKKGLYGMMGSADIKDALTVNLDAEPKGTRIEIICHGRIDQTKVIGFVLTLLDAPTDESDASTDGVPRRIDVQLISGAEEWVQSGITFESLCGSIGDCTAYREEKEKPSSLIVPGRRLLFRNGHGTAQVLKLPVAHIAAIHPRP